jgi:molybdenum cofactor cytidylyltransferase
MTAHGKLSLGAVLLAGGESRRFGADNKLLMPVGGAPLLAKVAQEILAAGIDELIVVTGAEDRAYREALGGLDVRLAHNPAWKEGLGGSIAAGIAALSPAHPGAFVIPADMPNLTHAMLARLADAFRGTPGPPVVVPVTASGGQRNPVLWPRRHFPKLCVLSGPAGGKSLLDTLAGERLDVAFEDESVFADIDTADDYERLIAGASR